MTSTTISAQAPARSDHALTVTPDHPVHPLGSHARVLLTGVFGPFAQDDEYSRRMNPMELYHNQVTRVQGPFSLRMFHRSWGIMMIQANIQAPTVLLDFPTRDQFLDEIRQNPYDIIGITSIVPNLKKVQAMCQWIREIQPQATIVIGGHVANMPGLDQHADADHIVRGEGIRWMRKFLGEDPEAPIVHPPIVSAFGAQTMGIKLAERSTDIAATIVPSVGCPMGCNFCSTSHMFGGKGKCIHLFESAEELFKVMCKSEATLGCCSFFIMDENFLFHRKRALRLLELIEEHDKAWALYVFSSANVLRSYTMDQLVRLGISWVWMGLEGEDSQYAKLKGMNTLELVKELQSHGIRVLGSTIIGLETHTPDNIDAAINHAALHDTEFHQFMLYTPLPGTLLFKEHEEAGTLLSREVIEEADVHGQYRFRHVHPRIPQGAEEEMVVRAFTKDFEVNGPSTIRVIRTTLAGWMRYRNHANPRIARRYRWEGRDLAAKQAGALWAASRWFAKRNPAVSEKIAGTLQTVYRECGLKARIMAPLIGRYILHMIKREAQRLDQGATYEPQCFRELNEPARALAFTTVAAR